MARASCGIRFHLPEDQPVFRKTRVVWKTGWSSGRRKMCRSILVLLAPPVGCGDQGNMFTDCSWYICACCVLVFRKTDPSSGRPIWSSGRRIGLPEEEQTLLEDRSSGRRNHLPEDGNGSHTIHTHSRRRRCRSVPRPPDAAPQTLYRAS